jgi:hypothetical protein
MLPAAGALLHELSPPEGGKEVIAQVSALLFSAFRYWHHGRHTYRITAPLLRQMFDNAVATAATAAAATPAAGDTPLRPPVPAGYVQLPRNAVWARVSEDSAAEPVDGFFWSAPTADESGGAERLDLLFALGVRPDRPGLSLFDVSLEAASQLAGWETVKARPVGNDFDNVLPGGELQDYHAIITAGEALKLAALCFRRIADLEWRASTDGSSTVHVPSHG